MMFENRIWRMDLKDIWLNANRRNIIAKLTTHFTSPKAGPAHLTGGKGAGKSVIGATIADRLNATFIMMHDNEEDMKNDFTGSFIIIDEAQKISLEERKRIMQINPKVLMISVSNLVDDGYKLFLEIEDLTEDEVESYISRNVSFTSFAKDSFAEIHKASKGRPRIINLLCNVALDEHAETNKKIDKNIIEHIAKRKFKLRY